MPLILSVTEGDDIYIDDDRVLVSRIIGETEVEIEVDGGPMSLFDDKATEVFPDVLISMGLLANNPRFVRLIITAPREKIILRGEKYREKIDYVA